MKFTPNFLALLFWLLAKVTATLGQTPLLISDTKAFQSELDITQNIEIYAGAPTDIPNYESMKKSLWIRVEKFKSKQQRFHELKKSDWLRFAITNSSNDSLKLLYYNNKSLLINAYFFKEDSLAATIKTGWLVNSTFPTWASNADNFSVPISIPAHQTRKIWINTINLLSSTVLIEESVKLYSNRGYLDFKTKLFYNRNKLYYLFYILLGICAFLGTISLFQFVIIKDKVYGWWFLYLFFTFLHFLRVTEFYYSIRIISALFPYFFLLNFTIENLCISSYCLFINAFLNINKYSPTLSKLAKITAFISFVIAIIAIKFGFGIHQNPWDDYLLRSIYFMLASSVFLVFYCRFKKIPLSNFVVIGFLCLFSGVLFSIYLNRNTITVANKNEISPSFYYAIGVLIEIFFFSLALSYRMRLINEEKNSLKAQYTQDLESQLEHRTLLINQQNRLVEEQRIKQIETDFEQKLSEIEMTALRSQMNPHFIFNCLNSIKSYALNNDTNNVSLYITKFARLIRLVLENSKSEKITLKNEIETIQLYMEMEKLRFGNKFEFEIKMEADMEEEFIEIPPLLIQPYIENAIWHGLMQKNEKGKVTVYFTQIHEKTLQIIIEDDGIGRAKAKELKSKTATNQKSYGMKITSQRLEIIQQRYNVDVKLHIEDLTNPLGTRVIIEIPI